MPKVAHALHKVLILILILLSSLRANSQTEQWFTSDDNLSSSLINKIFYDSRGMIWVVTEYGLNRFDGSKFTIYHSSPNDSTSIASNFINNIFEDRDRRLFISTHRGVQVYNPATDRFTPPLRVDGVGEVGIAMSDVVQTIGGDIWAFGNKVYRIEGTLDKPVLKLTKYEEYNNIVHRSVCDTRGNIWLSSRQHGVTRISPDGAMKHYLDGPADVDVNTMALAQDGTLYIGTASKGMMRYERRSDSFVPVDLGASALSISVLYPDKAGNIYVGTDGLGLKVYTPADGSIYTYHFPEIDSEHLKVHAITTDNYGNLWVGIYQKGMVKIPPESNFFNVIGRKSVGFNLIGDCCVTAIYRGSNKQLMVGTDNDGVYAVDLATAQSRHFTDGVPSAVVTLFEDSRERLWVGSYDKGCGILDVSSGRFTPLALTENGKRVRHVYAFAEMSDGRILIGTLGCGVLLHNPATGTTQRVALNTISDWVTSLEISKLDGSIYVGGYDGLYILDKDLKSAMHVGRSMIIYTIHEEPHYGHVWLGTSEGLVKIDSKREIERIYTTADGLPSQSVYAIEHGEDALWISSNRGLTKFKPKEGTFCNFTVDNGLPNNEFSKNSSFKDDSGNIFFGGISGIAYFKSADIHIDIPKPTLRLTDFFVGDRAIHAGDLSGDRLIVDCPLEEAEKFCLNYNDNTFSVRFSTVEFLEPTQAQFFYSLDGSEWIGMPASNAFGASTLMFSNMPSGTHKLMIKALNGGVESEPLSLVIDIDRVWYATWWARLIYLLIFLAGMFMVYQYMQHRQQVKREAEERRNQARILESKLQFFTNISHEIRTPLSLVISPLQKLIDTDPDAERSSAYRTIMRNANRILRLVNELMDLRKIDNKQMKMRFTEVNLCDFVSDLYETFSPAARQRNITLIYNHSGCENLKAWVDKSNFDKIIMNLLSNALKFTPEHGTITIALCQGEAMELDTPLRRFAEISVTDTGIGISEDERKKVFNRFFQASNNASGGTGIGLHLTHQLVELHHGSIEITDNPDGQGTRFVMRVPLGCEHLSDSEIIANELVPKTVFDPINEKNIAARMINASESDAVETTAPKSRDIVYVVEDDEEIRRYLVDELGKYYRTEGFSNGRIALERIHEQCPALVITDVMMPEMDGLTLTRKIKQNINLNHVPVVVLTAMTREEDNISVMENGANAYVTKPFSIDVVLKTVENQIDSVKRLKNALTGNQDQADKLEKIEVASNDEKLMERVMRVVNKNMSNADITVEMIAREIGISRVHLHRKLKELTNQSTRDFLRNVRLQAAAKLLREKKLSVAEVSDLVGFKQANNFSAAFKEMFGMTPTAYAQHHRDDVAEA